MVALQIRDFPAELRDKLAAIAHEQGQSLQAYLFDVLAEEARRRDNLAVLKQFSGTSYGTSLTKSDVLDALHAGRAERDERLGLPGDIE